MISHASVDVGVVTGPDPDYCKRLQKYSSELSAVEKLDG